MTLGVLVGIIIFIGVILYEVLTEDRTSSEEHAVQTYEFEAAEIQLLDLLHLVETENKRVFAELVAYSGPDKNRYLKTHVDLRSATESQTNDRYFSALQKIIDYCYTQKPQTGDFDTDFSFVITNSQKEWVDGLEIVRVRMNYCLPDEVECIDDSFYFDFIMGEKEYLLLDIDKAGLYKK